MMKRLAILAVALAAAGAAPVHAADLQRTYGNPKAPFASTVTVPASAELVFFSGAIAPPPAAAPANDPLRTTEGQTEAILKQLEAGLKAQGLTLSNVVNLRVYLVGDPAKGGAMDFAGMNAAYGKVFGTAAQPDRPTRAAVQVAGLAVAGALVEIEITAAKPAR